MISVVKNKMVSMIRRVKDNKKYGRYRTFTYQEENMRKLWDFVSIYTTQYSNTTTTVRSIPILRYLVQKYSDWNTNGGITCLEISTKIEKLLELYMKIDFKSWIRFITLAK